MEIHNLHTEMLLLGLGPFDQAEEELGEVADDDEGRGQCRAAVVFHNQVVSLELPEDVRVALHHLERVAANGEKKTKKPLAQLTSSDRSTNIWTLDFRIPGP